MIQQIVTKTPTYGNQAFDHGVRHGISWHLTGDAEYRQPTAQLIVDFIRDNFLEPQQEGYLDEDRLMDHAGCLVGWIRGEFVCSKQ